jgi:hypothetical protein
VTTELAPHYLVDGKGNFFYPLTNPIFGSTGVVARSSDGRIIDDVRMSGSSSGYQTNAWYITREVASAFLFPRNPAKVTVGYRLKDETAESARYPLTLTPDEYQAKRSAEDPDDDGETGLTYIMYRAITEEREVDPYVLDVSSMSPMIGEGDENSTWAWEVERTAGLLYGSWYHHLLPGTLVGVKERLAKKLESTYGKRDFFRARTGFDTDSRTGAFQVWMNLPFDVPVFKTSPRYGRSGQKLKGTQQVQELVPLRIEWNQGTLIQAKNKAEAVAEYQRVEDRMMAWVDSHRLTVCSRCKGNGYTETHD